MTCMDSCQTQLFFYDEKKLLYKQTTTICLILALLKSTTLRILYARIYESDPLVWQKYRQIVVQQIDIQHMTYI